MEKIKDFCFICYDFMVESWNVGLDMLEFLAYGDDDDDLLF